MRKSKLLLPIHHFSILCLLGRAATGLAATTTYTIQTGNFNQEITRIPPSGFAGSFNQGAKEVGLYAHGGLDGTNVTDFQTFSTTGTTAGTVRALQVGDSFSLTLYSGTNPFGFAGVYFNDNTNYSAYSDYSTNQRTAVVLGTSGNWVVENAGTAVNTGIGSGVSLTIGMAVTSSNTFNMTVNGTTYHDLVMQNAPGSTAHIQSFALALQNDNGANFFVKNGSLIDTGLVTVGGSNLSLTTSGVITDGLVSNSTSAVTANALTKTGSGTITLTGANTYSGKTTISAGTLLLNGTTSANTITSTGGTASGGAPALQAASSDVQITSGTLQLGKANQIVNTAKIALSGGKLHSAGFSEGDRATAGVGALTLSANSIIDFGTGGANTFLHFGASDGQSWSGNLDIYNWTGSTYSANPAGNGTDQLIFGTANTSLTSLQADSIRFFSGAGTGFLGTGVFTNANVGELVPVPEPATIFGALGLLGLMGYRERRRLFGRGLSTRLDRASA